MDRILVNVRGRHVRVPRKTLTSIPWFQNYLENNECATSIELDKPYEPLSHVLNFARTGRTEYLKEEHSKDYAWYGLCPDPVVTFHGAPLRMVTAHVAGEERSVRANLLSKLGVISGQAEWREHVGSNEPLYVDTDVGHFDAIVHYLNTGDTRVLTPDVRLTMEYLCIHAPPAPPVRVPDPNRRNHLIFGGECTESISAFLPEIPIASNNATASASGVPVGGFYRLGGDPDALQIRNA